MCGIMDQPSKQCKRDAVGDLCDLAVDIGVDVAGRRKADLAESEFGFASGGPGPGKYPGTSATGF